MKRLDAKLALLLAGAFVVVGGALVVVTQRMFDPGRLLGLTTQVMVASVAFALLVALAVFQFFTRRLSRLADAVERLAQGGFRTPLRVPGADAQGDEIARLALRVEQMSHRIAEQLDEQARGVERRRELLVNVSHDLRTPLASMQGYLELLLVRRGKLEPAEERNYLETAVRQSERLGRLVADLFELTRLEAAEAVPQFEPFAHAELAHDVVQRFAPDAGQRGVRMQAVCAGECDAGVQAWADIGMVERVLVNLVDNALRHTPRDGTVDVVYGVARDDEGRPRRATLAVHDTGKGIAPHDLPGIFDRYYDRADRTAPQAHGGLGLAIAQHIVRLHGGTIAVHSQLGEGTRFGFDLPLAAAPGAHATTPQGATTHAIPVPPRDGARPGAGGRDHARAPRAQEEIAQLRHQLDAQHTLIDHVQADRAAAQAEARASEERLAVALRGSQDGQWEWLLDDNHVQLSPRWKSMLGFTSDDLPDDFGAWRARVHPDDRAGFEAALGQHLVDVQRDGEARFDHELRLLHKDGSVRWVLSRGVALRRTNGAPYRMVGFDTDVTRLKHVLAVLDAVVAGTTGTWGQAFFEALVEHFGRALEVDVAFITECADYPTTRLRTLAVWTADGPKANFEYSLAGSPCESVVQGTDACFHRSGVGALYPREAGYEAYLGLPIIASDGRMLGHLAFLDRGPRGDEMLVDAIYRIFVARAAAEMERMRALASLRDAQPIAPL